MKKKLKYFCILISSLMVLPTITHAASLNINEKSKSDNKIEYNITYTKEENDEVTDLILFDISTSNNNVTINVTPNSEMGNAVCNNTKCSIPFQNIKADDIPIEVATITVFNNTEKDIKNFTLTLKMNDVEYKKENISLTAGKTTERPKSDVARLSGITVSGGGVLDKTFKSDIDTYTVTGIKDTIPSVTINATCDENCSDIKYSCPVGGCEIKDNNNIKLQLGLNQVSIMVVSENGASNKTYTLNIYRGEIEASSAYLDSLKIEDFKLSPYFDSMTNDYTASMPNDIKEFSFDAKTEDPKATMVIKFNGKEIDGTKIKDIIDGENVLTITVTSSDGENKQVYTITLTKEEKAVTTTEEVVNEGTKVEKKKKSNVLLIVIISIIGVGIITTVGIILFKKKKNKNKSDKDKDNKNDSNGGSSNKLDDEDHDLDILEDALSKTGEQNIDDALDDLMKTKKLELGDLDF